MFLILCTDKPVSSNGKDFGFPVPVTKETRLEVRHTCFLLLQDMDQEVRHNDVYIYPTEISIRESQILVDTDNSKIQLLQDSLVIQKDSVSNVIHVVDSCTILRFRCFSFRRQKRDNGYSCTCLHLMKTGTRHVWKISIREVTRLNL